MRSVLKPLENKFVLMVLAGLASIFVFSIQFQLSQALSVFSVAVIVAGATLMLGILLGFLFGIPRTLGSQTFQKEDVNRETDSQSYNSKDATRYTVNTNLEQISDWLTKILVGVGLTQIPTLRQEIGQLISYLQPGLGNSSSFTAALLVYFFVSGFITGYLWTRLNLIGELRKAEQQNLSERIDNLEEQKEIDADALALVGRQLNLSGPEVPQEQLDALIAKASAFAKVAIFEKAHTARIQNSQQPNGKVALERTIAVFHALIQSDPERRFHRVRGELGLALQDKPNPSANDLREAEAQFTQAIEIRGDWREKREQAGYEFARALCRIKLHGNDAAQQGNIIHDLAVAIQGGVLSEKMLEQATFMSLKTWIAENVGDFNKLKSHTASLVLP